MAVCQPVIKASDLLTMLEEQTYRCALTGRMLTPETAAVDHRDPLSRTGRHELDNLHIVHEQVNAAKATMTEEEFIRLCRDVVAWADRPR